MNEKNQRMDKGYEDEKPVTPVHISNPTVRAIVNQQPSETDPNGSYTGKPENPYEIPQQDADDL